MVCEKCWPLYSIWSSSETNGFISRLCRKKRVTMDVIMRNPLFYNLLLLFMPWANQEGVHLEVDVSAIAKFRAL